MAKSKPISIKKSSTPPRKKTTKKTKRKSVVVYQKKHTPHSVEFAKKLFRSVGHSLSQYAASTAATARKTLRFIATTADQTRERTQEVRREVTAVSAARLREFRAGVLKRRMLLRAAVRQKRDAVAASLHKTFRFSKAKPKKKEKKKVIYDAKKKTAQSRFLTLPSFSFVKKFTHRFFEPKQPQKKSAVKSKKKNIELPAAEKKKPRFLSLFLRVLWSIFEPFWYVFRYHPFISFGCIFVSVGILASAYVVYDVIFKDLPSVELLSHRQQLLTTRILDRNGQLLYRIYKDENRTLIPLSRIPENVKHATISIEDREFYSHHGFSVKGIVRAIKENTAGEKKQGGSTITQQLVKNTLLTSEKTYKRKARELLLAFIVESNYSKDEILEMYLNEVAYGGSTYGVEEAAQRYFGKSVTQLSLAESAFLAGLPAAPSAYSPFGSSPEYAYVRQKEVLRRMVEDKYITEDQANEAKKEELHFKPNSIDIKAPHFVMYVRNLLEKQYGPEVVNQGGLEVRTTLDLNTQNVTQEIVTKEMEMLARLRISNGAALVTNPKTGEIIAMIGSKNYFDFANDGQVNVTMSPRQPGSSMKTLTYAIALENGKSPSTTIADEPTRFSIAGSPPYEPRNYDGRFHGNVTIREALGSSYNIPAVKTLQSIGISTLIDKAEQIGVTTWRDRRRFGLSLTLGGGEVLMTELSQIYGTFATYGETVQLNPILEVKNAKGEVLYRNTCALENKDCPARRNFTQKVAYQISDILSDNNARAPGFGLHSVLNIPGQQVAVKTGTTNNLRDNWAIGYTQDRVVAVWVGNNDNHPMSYVASGITGASPIWNKIMRTQLSDANPHKFPVPDGLIKVKVCARTGTLPCAGCPAVREELFVPGTEPTTACNPAQFRPKPSPSPKPDQPPRDRILDGVFIQP